MASIRGISNDIFAYLPRGHTGTKTSSRGKADLQVTWAQCGSGVLHTVYELPCLLVSSGSQLVYSDPKIEFMKSED